MSLDASRKATARRMYDGGAVRPEPRNSLDDFPALEREGDY